jgi:hypothetical protein
MKKNSLYVCLFVAVRGQKNIFFGKCSKLNETSFERGLETKCWLGGGSKEHPHGVKGQKNIFFENAQNFIKHCLG